LPEGKARPPLTTIKYTPIPSLSGTERRHLQRMLALTAASWGLDGPVAPAQPERATAWAIVTAFIGTRPVDALGLKAGSGVVGSPG
jgi:hypothetical protein